MKTFHVFVMDEQEKSLYSTEYKISDGVANAKPDHEWAVDALKSLVNRIEEENRENV